jgi:transposase
LSGNVEKKDFLKRSKALAIQTVLWYNKSMERLNLHGLPPEVAAYISMLEQRVEQLTDMLRKLQKMQFGASSEKAKYVLGNPDQLSFFNEAEACADETAPEPEVVAEHTRKPKRTKEELARSLPVKKTVIEIPEAERICDVCEGPLVPIGQELVRRELNVIPAQVFVEEIYRVNYACPQCEEETDEANIVKAPVPEPVVKRGLASPSSVAHVLVQKFVNAMPLYRQEKDWALQGVSLSRATLANWIIYVCLHWFTPLYELMKTQLRASPVIHADETVIQVLKEDGKTPQSESRMWVYATGNTGGSPIILFEYQPSRSGAHAKQFLAGFGGYLVSDGYVGYNSVPDVIHCGCWQHARRKWTDAIPKTKDKEGIALKGFEFCQRLFELERTFANMTPEERLTERLKSSGPVLEAYFAWLETVNPLGGSKLKDAVGYSRNQRTPLSAFLLDGRIEISNNRAENSIRPFCIGRKNFLFADTVRGAQSSALAYSIIETAKANGLNPYQYLLYLLSNLPGLITKGETGRLPEFLPWASELPELCRKSAGADRVEIH